MTKQTDETPRLAPFFDAVRDDTPEAGDAFLARLEDQAVAAMAPRPTETARVGFLDLIGGWVGVGGLATAGLAGVWIGLAPPSGVPDPGLYWTDQDEIVTMLDDWSALTAPDTEGATGDE